MRSGSTGMTWSGSERPRRDKEYKDPMGMRILTLACAALLGGRILPAAEVKPIDWARAQGDVSNDPIARRCADIARFCCKGLAKPWRDACATKKRVGDFVDFGSSEGDIRGAASTACNFAAALRLGLYDGQAAGVPREAMAASVVLAVRSLARDHAINGGLDKPWGDSWQTAMWAAKVAETAWLIWEEIPEEDRARIARMLEHEADRFLNAPPPASNKGSTKDTKGEENAWNAGCLEIAALMMPAHPNAARWRDKGIDYRMTAAAAPGDVNSAVMIDGKKASERISGYCLTEDYAAGNHGIYPHPDYTAHSYVGGLRMLAYYSLAGVRPPRGNLFNADKIYRMFVDHAWPFPPYAEPGGPFYRRDGTIYWPAKGESDRAGRYYIWFSQDLLIDALRLDRGCSVPAATWADLHSKRILDAMDGATGKIKLPGYSPHSYLSVALNGYLVRLLVLNGRFLIPDSGGTETTPPK
jgi:hypothetical protein